MVAKWRPFGFLLVLVVLSVPVPGTLAGLRDVQRVPPGQLRAVQVVVMMQPPLGVRTQVLRSAFVYRTVCAVVFIIPALAGLKVHRGLIMPSWRFYVVPAQKALLCLPLSLRRQLAMWAFPSSTVRSVRGRSVRWGVLAWASNNGTTLILTGPKCLGESL